MIEEKKLFPSQDQEEKVMMVIRKHWFNYIVFFVLAALVLLPLLGFLLYWGANPDLLSADSADIAIIVMGIYVLSLLALELYGFVNYYLDVYIVTDRRIVDITQDGFFRRKISELHLRQIQDVSAKVDGVFQTFLHFGDVFIQTAGERENFLFKSVPHPYTTSKMIINLHQHYIENPNEPLPAEVGDDVYDNIESDAKKIVKNTSFKDKISTNGIFVRQDPDAAYVGTPGVQESGQGDSTESGVLTEGEEVDLK